MTDDFNVPPGMRMLDRWIEYEEKEDEEEIESEELGTEAESSAAWEIGWA